MVLMTVEYGHCEVKYVPPKLVERRIKRKFWFDKIEYWIEYEYFSTGGWSNRKEGEKWFAYALSHN